MKGIFKIASCIALISTTGMSAEVINQAQLEKIGSGLARHSLTELTYGTLSIIDNYEKKWQAIKPSNPKKGWLNNISPELFQKVNEIYTQSTFFINEYSNLYSEIYITKLQTLVNEIEQALIDKETVYVEKRVAEWPQLEAKLLPYLELMQKARNEEEVDIDSDVEQEIDEALSIAGDIYNDLQTLCATIEFIYPESIKSRLMDKIKQSDEILKKIKAYTD